MPTLGQVIARHRTHCGISQAELAKRVGLSRGGVAQLELDMVKWPRPETLQRLAEVLEVPLVELLREADILPPADGEQDAEIRRLIDAKPEFAELFELARKYPDYLPIILRVAKWIVLEQVNPPPKPKTESDSGEPSD